MLVRAVFWFRKLTCKKRPTTECFINVCQVIHFKKVHIIFFINFIPSFVSVVPMMYGILSRSCKSENSVNSLFPFLFSRTIASVIFFLSISSENIFQIKSSFCASSFSSSLKMFCTAVLPTFFVFSCKNYVLSAVVS